MASLHREVELHMTMLLVDTAVSREHIYLQYSFDPIPV